jgi:hypothetical protein
MPPDRSHHFRQERIDRQFRARQQPPQSYPALFPRAGCSGTDTQIRRAAANGRRMDIVLLFGSREGRRRLIIMKVVDAPHGRKASPAAACSRSRGPAPGFARGTDALLSGVQPAPDLPKMQAAVRAMRILHELRRLLLTQCHLVLVRQTPRLRAARGRALWNMLNDRGAGDMKS